MKHTLGEQIGLYRKAAGLTQSQLAEALDVSFQTVSGWERNEYMPDVGKLPLIAQALHVPTGRLLEESKTTDLPRRERLFDEAHMYTFVKSACVSKGRTQSLTALTLMKERHAHQFRKNLAGEKIPYINHPLTLACHALAMGLDDDELLAALLLHDVVEDGGLSPADLPCNASVQQVVALVSKQGNGITPPASVEEYFKRIVQNPMACLVKCMDRVNNLSNMATGFTPDKMAEYVRETETYIVPLLRTIKEASPAWNNAAWLLTYQMISMLEAFKRLL